MKILVIEDHAGLLVQLRSALLMADYDVVTADNGEEGLFLAREYKFDLAIIDIGLPDMSGLDVIRTIRREALSLPVLILTARSSWQDKVEGLKVGADDYLAKPFQFEELLARVEALLRRAGGFLDNVLRRGSFTLNLQTQELFADERPVDLTAFEHKVLEYFMRHPMRIVSKLALMDYLYDQETERDSNVLEVIIGRLRRKLDPDNRIKPIETLRGRGYRFTIKD